MKEYGKINLTLTVDEVYAIQGIILGLEGLTGKICKDYNVNNMNLYQKLEELTDKWTKTRYSQTPPDEC